MKALLAVSVVLAVMFVLSGCGVSGQNEGGAPPPIGKETPKSEPLGFEAWAAMTGEYVVSSFDGSALVGRNVVTSLLRESGRYSLLDGGPIDLIKFPLYDSVGQGGAHAWNFGPMREIGQSTVVRGAAETIYTYECAGEKVSYGRHTFQVWLRLDVRQAVGSSNLEVQYTLRVPGLTEQSSHRFLLTAR